MDLDRVYLSQLNRNANRLRVLRRHPNDGGNTKDAIPPLYDPQLLTFGTEFGAMITGFEDIDGQRYYQGWYIRWVE